MAQETGSDILARARIYALDNDTGGNFTIGATNALIMLNDVLERYGRNVVGRKITYPASTSGLTFNANTATVLTTAGVNIADVLTAHPSDTNAEAYPLAPELERVSIERMAWFHQNLGGGTTTQQAHEFLCWAAERDGENQDKWRFWVYPTLDRARSLTIRALPWYRLALIGDTPDFGEDDTRNIARLLAYDMALTQKENTLEWCQTIIAPLSGKVLAAYYGGGDVAGKLQQPEMQDTGWLGS